MTTRTFSMPRQFGAALLFLLFAWAGAAGSQAQDATATAALSKQTASVGEPVLLQIEVQSAGFSIQSGSRPEIAVDGLQIRYGNSQFNTQFGSVSGTSITHVFQIIPEREGVFTIPAITVTIGRQQATTSPVALTVQAGPPAQAGPRAFLEITLPKPKVYVGQPTPVEVRFFIDTEIQRWDIKSMPSVEGEGFTAAKMPQPREERARRDGREYRVIVFRTVITPSRAGKIAIGPASLDYQAMIPRARPTQPRQGMNDRLFDRIFNDPFGAFSQTEERRAQAEGVELDVRPLPQEGRPGSFAGAVGTFEIAALGKPDKVGIGDPVTMTLTITGQGAFERVSAPVLRGNGWRGYPPSVSFKPEDDFETRGVKTFEVAVIPEQKQTEMPRFDFSFFDPEAEKYVVLTTPSVPLTVEGAPPPAPPAPVVQAPAQATTNAAPAPAAPAQPSDIWGIKYEFGAPRDFRPLYKHPAFVLFQLLPLAALLYYFTKRMGHGDAAAQEAANLRRDRAALVARLQAAQQSAEFYDLAARALQMDAALGGRTRPEALDAAAVCQARKASPEEAALIHEIFAVRAEALYAGAGAGSGGHEISETERQRVLALVQ